MSGTGLAGLHPAMLGFTEMVPLSGFSGAQVALLRSNGGAHFVRKAAWNTQVSDTLRKQACRQRWLQERLTEDARMPEILDEGEVDGLFYFDMAFVPSRDAVSFLGIASFDRIKGFAGRVERLLHTLARTQADASHAREPSKEAVLAKLDEIALRTEGRHAAVLDPLRRATLRLARLMADADTAATAVHGDLTFENILVGRNDELWLIDTIESPFDHYWIDWSKLFQECEGGWHNHRGRSIPTGVTRWLRTRWMMAATAQTPSYAAHHYILLGLTFARILPYAQTERDSVFTAERVRRYGEAALAQLQGLAA